MTFMIRSYHALYYQLYLRRFAAVWDAYLSVSLGKEEDLARTSPALPQVYICSDALLGILGGLDRQRQLPLC